MSDERNDTIDNNEPPKLYANKYKSIEDLENGYKNSTKQYLEVETKLKAKEAEYSVPEDYSIPEGISISDDDIKLNKSIAKKAGLSQRQFEEVIKNVNDLSKSHHESVEKARADARAKLNADELKLCEKFIEENYPTNVAKSLLNDIVQEDVFNFVKAERARKVDNKAPGINVGDAAPVQKGFDQKALEEAHRKTIQYPGNKKFEQEYIGLINKKVELKRAENNK